MALVQVPDGGVDAEGAQGADAADAQHDLLAEPHLAAADVEDVGDRRSAGRCRDVGVEQETGTRPTCATQTAAWTVAAGQLDARPQRPPVAAATRAAAAAGGVVVRLGVLLVAVGVDCWRK